MSKTLNATFPSVIRDQLRAVRMRRTAFAALRALALGLTVLLVAMLAAMLIDWAVTLFDTRVRVALTTSSLLFGVATLLLTGWRPIRKALGWTSAAEQVDQRVPQMEERWLTVASMAAARQEPTDPAARAMLARVTGEAVAMSRLVQPKNVVGGQLLHRPLLGLGAALVALGVFFASHWGQTTVLWQRFWSPTLNISATQLKLITGDLNVPRGNSVEVLARMEGLQRKSVELVLRRESTPDMEERLTATPASPSDGSVRFPVDVDETVRYRVQAGDGRTDWHTLTAIDYPELKDVRLTVAPPKYVDEPANEKTLIPSRLRAVQGSQLELAIKPHVALKSLTLQIAMPVAGQEGSDSAADRAKERFETLVLNRGDDGWYRFETALVESFSFTPILISEHDLQNRNPRVCRVEVVEDHAPVARIVSPSGESSASLDEVLDIRFEAHDDHGIATAELVIYDEKPKNGEAPKVLAVRQIPLGDQAMQKHVMGKIELDLKELGLKDGTNISYAVRVTDNRDLELDSTSPLNQLLASLDKGKMPEQDGDDHHEMGDHPPGESSQGQQSTGEKSPGSKQPTADDDGQKTSSEKYASGDPASKPAGDKPSGESSESPATEGPPRDGDSGEKPSGESDSEGDKASDDDPQAMLAQTADGESPPGERAATESAPNTAAGNPPKNSSTASQPNVATSKDGDPRRNGSPTNNAASQPEQSGDQLAEELLAAAQSSQPKDGQPNEGQPMSAPGTDKNNPLASPDSNSQTGSLPEGDAMPPTGNQNAKKNPLSDQAKMAKDGSPSPDKKPQGEQTKDEQQPVGQITLDGESNPPAPTEPAQNEPTDLQKNPSNASPQLAKVNNAKGMKSRPSNGSSSNEPPPTKNMRLNPQQIEAGQRQETDRRQLRIVSRLDAVAASNDAKRDSTKPVRDKVVQIDKMLETIEGKLDVLYHHKVSDSLRGDGYRELDVLLKNVEEFVSELGIATQETAFEFVGLQMIDITGNHVTPARDAVFIAIRTPDSGADVPTEEALHHVVSARELLQALLKRYDSVAQEKELAEKLNDAVKMYSVYVERSQRLMQEAQQNRDPLRLQREMEVVEVDQAYLDRLAEVTRMRRDMMSELARILSDDPRLRSRYLDLIKRRRSSLSNQLAELAARQDQAAQEVTGWISVEDNQRANYWQQVSDVRLDAPNALAKEAQQLADRVEKQLPLALDPAVGAAAATVATAKKIALDARRCDLDVRQVRKSGEPRAGESALSGSAEALVYQIGELAAALDRLQFESESLDGVSDYVQRRQIEVRALADLADTWSVTAQAVEQQKFSKLAGLDQHQIAIATELLRAEMLDIEADLAGEFDQEVTMPQEVINLTQDLQRIMESITHNQASATFALGEERIDNGSAQQELALKGFEEAQKILNLLRRKTAEALDKKKPVNPSIADLEDPTLDQFLSQMEREPTIEAQLGIPDRPRNIRMLQDAMTWQKVGGGLLGNSEDGAMARMQEMMKKRLKPEEGDDPQDQRTAKSEPDEKQTPTSMTDEEKQQLADAEEMQKMLKDRMEKAQKELEEQAKDPTKTEEQRRQLAEMAARISRSLQEMEKGQSPEQLWRQMAEADQAKAALEALAKGEQIPDEQWNKLMSTLGDGQGQVTGRVPSEDYRKAIEQYQERIRQLTGGK